LTITAAPKARLDNIAKREFFITASFFKTLVLKILAQL
jgi:hypothetical protein